MDKEKVAHSTARRIKVAMELRKEILSVWGVLCTCLAGPKFGFCFPCLFVCLCVRTYHICNNYITYIVAVPCS